MICAYSASAPEMIMPWLPRHDRRETAAPGMPELDPGAKAGMAKGGVRGGSTFIQLQRLGVRDDFVARA